MSRNVVALLVGCLYVAGSAWLVMGEGETYRETLRRDRLAAPRAESVPSAPPRPESEPIAASGDTRSMPPRTSGPSRDSSAVPAPVPPAEADRPEPPPPTSTTALVEAKPKSASMLATTPVADRRRDPSPVTAPQPTAVDPFWDQPYLKKSWDLANLSTQEEARLGAELHGLILQLNQRSDSGPWQRRVEEAAKPFRETCRRKDVSYTFTVLEFDAVCTFSHPGGYVYVCRGLFNLIGEEEDYALEFAVGHEIAHVDLQHALGCLRNPGVVKIPMGTLQKLFMIIIPFAYLDDQEFEADRWTYSRMRQSGRTDRETLSFLRKLEGYAKKNGFENGHVQPKPNAESSLLENHFRAHTATWKRLDHLKEFIATASTPKK